MTTFGEIMPMPYNIPIGGSGGIEEPLGSGVFGRKTVSGVSSWEPVVDLVSDQTIEGTKTFKGFTTNGINTEWSSPSNDRYIRFATNDGNATDIWMIGNPQIRMYSDADSPGRTLLAISTVRSVFGNDYEIRNNFNGFWGSGTTASLSTDAGKIVVTDPVTGKIDNSLLPSSIASQETA